MENQQYPYTQKETLVDKIKIFVNKEGPYVLRAIIRFFVNLIVLLIRFVKTLFKTALDTFTGKV